MMNAAVWKFNFRQVSIKIQLCYPHHNCAWCCSHYFVLVVSCSSAEGSWTFVRHEFTSAAVISSIVEEWATEETYAALEIQIDLADCYASISIWDDNLHQNSVCTSCASCAWNVDGVFSAIHFVIRNLSTTEGWVWSWSRKICVLGPAGSRWRFLHEQRKSKKYNFYSWKLTYLLKDTMW